MPKMGAALDLDGHVQVLELHDDGYVLRHLTSDERERIIHALRHPEVLQAPEAFDGVKVPLADGQTIDVDHCVIPTLLYSY